MFFDRNKKMVVGMIHLQALPGTPKYGGSIQTIIQTACDELKIYLNCGVDAIMIENMHDVPYLNRKVGAEIVATMTSIAVQLRALTNLPLGIQILAGANTDALAVAKAAGFSFIRAEGFVFGHVADEGIFESDAGKLLRYRKLIDAEEIEIWTDIKKKHASHSITSDVSIAETVKAADYFLSDGIIVTGTSTGVATQIEDVRSARLATALPIIIGSGMTVDNLKAYWDLADVFIVGSSFKMNGNWKNTVDVERVMSFMKQVQQLRN